jgi:hypothetical protein
VLDSSLQATQRNYKIQNKEIKKKDNILIPHTKHGKKEKEKTINPTRISNAGET